MVEEKKSGDKNIFEVMAHKNDSSPWFHMDFHREMNSAPLSVRENVKLFGAASVSSALERKADLKNT